MNVLRDASVILLAAEVFLFGLIPLLIFGALVYGVWWLRRHRNLPTWLRRTHCTFDLGLSYVELGMRRIAWPIVWAHRTWASLRAWTRVLRGGRVQHQERAVESGTVTKEVV